MYIHATPSLFDIGLEASRPFISVITSGSHHMISRYPLATSYAVATVRAFMACL
jgi:hypothetical protein